jgi:hypothetical protein
MAYLKFNSYSATLAVCLLMFLNFACAEREETGGITKIEIEKNIDNFLPFTISDLDCEIEYVVLETTSESMLIGVWSVDISDDYILVADRDKCLLFDRNGNFISKIGSQGRGPGENRAFTQVKIFNDKIFLPDGLSNMMNIFNINGEFIHALKSPGKFYVLNSNSWMPVTDSTFLVHIPNITGNEENRAVLINNNGEILQKYANTTFYIDGSDKSMALTPATFYKHNGNIHFKQSLNDTIWQLSDGYLNPSYVLDLGKYGISFEYYELPWVLFREKLADGITIENIFETRDYILLSMNFWRNYPFDFYRENPFNQVNSVYNIIGLYTKTGGEFFHVAPSNVDHQIEPTGFKNDIDGGINFLPKYAVNDTLLVSWFHAYELEMYVASETFKNSIPKYPDKKKQLEELAASLDENDNPVLMVVKLAK